MRSKRNNPTICSSKSPKRSIRYVQNFTPLSMLKDRRGRVFDCDIWGRGDCRKGLQA